MSTVITCDLIRRSQCAEESKESENGTISEGLELKMQYRQRTRLQNKIENVATCLCMLRGSASGWPRILDMSRRMVPPPQRASLARPGPRNSCLNRHTVPPSRWLFLPAAAPSRIRCWTCKTRPWLGEIAEAVVEDV